MGCNGGQERPATVMEASTAASGSMMEPFQGWRFVRAAVCFGKGKIKLKSSRLTNLNICFTIHHVCEMIIW
jgi:hypothetical protein